jgi:hypothetical protein
MRSHHLALAIALTLLLFPTATGRAQTGPPSQTPGLFPFVLPWDDASPGVTNVSGLLGKPAGKLGPVVVKDGHFYTGAKRLRLFGVNLCFASDFPAHGDAEKVAARMAKFGINAVRFHHMDNQPTPNGIWGRDGYGLDPGQLDKLDYLFAQLKKHGIYADINLHVSHEYHGSPRWEGMPSYFKGVDNFDLRMIMSQRYYALHLLTHVNPYTKMRYADDPAVAIVEINNENALTHEWFSGELDDMPQTYVDTLTKWWNVFLEAKYANDAALRAAWGAKSLPPGAEMLRNGSFARGLEGWNIERIEGAEAVAQVVASRQGQRVLSIEVPRPAKEAWHVQIDQGGFAVRADRPYTFTFTASADRPRRLSVNVMQAHDPWQQLWSSEVSLTERSQTFRLVVQPGEADRDARVTFTGLGDRAGRVSLGGVSLRPGGVVGLEPGESLGTIAWVKKRDFSRRTAEAQRDWLRLLSDVETRYWTGMARALREFGLKAPIVGTPMGWSPPAVQAHLDVIDSHSYWQHPNFPGRPWDGENWVVPNLPMAGRPDGGTLPALGLSRLAGKPFICTEYNHSAPSTYASETAPVIFAYAAWQDWDGVFLFAYSHRGDAWDTGSIGGFFDIDQHPTKMATLPAVAALFLRGDVPAEPPALAHITPEQFLESLRKRGPWGVAETFGLTRADALSQPVAMVLDTKPSVEKPARSAHLPQPWAWRSEEGRGVLTLDTPRSKVVVTGVVPGKFNLGGVTFAPERNAQAWAVFTATALDGASFQSPGKILITATGLAENTGMHWKDAKHESVGRDWGGRPSLVEGIAATVTLTVPGPRVRAWALDERGQRREPVSVAGHGQTTTVALDPQYKTLWYEIEIGP